MAAIEELAPLNLGKGCEMRLFIDHSKESSDPLRTWTESTYDGGLSSNILSIPAHWHRNHDEIMTVLSGRMTFFVAGRNIVATPSTGPIVIPRRTVHGFSVVKGEAVTFREQTVPSGEFKLLFFQDLFQDGKGVPRFLEVMRASYEGDTVLALTGGRVRVLEELFVSVLGYIATFFVSPKPPGLVRTNKASTQQ